MIMELN